MEDIYWPISVEAEYEQKIIGVTYFYLNNKNEWVEVENAIPVAKDATREELEAEFKKFRPSDGSESVKFKEWQVVALQDYIRIVRA